MDNASAAPGIVTQDTWSGAYVGAFVGPQFGHADINTFFMTGADLQGLTGGAYAGYNFETDGIVFGIEGDVGKSSATGTGSTSEDGSYTYSIDWNAHLRGRIGLAVEHALFYLSGGLAIASPTLNIAGSSDSVVHVGTTIGGGVEVALTDTLTVRGEYLFDNYGTQTYFDTTGDHEIGLTSHTVRAGVAVKF